MTLAGSASAQGGAQSSSLAIWHWGSVVADIDAAIADWYRLGAVAHSPVGRIETHTYDAERRQVYPETLDVAWVRLGRNAGVVELICPVESDSDAPQKRLLAARPALTHSALWCDDLIQDASTMLAQGAELVIAPLLGADHAAAALAASDAQALLAHAQTCYLRLPSGQLIELNPRTAYPFLPSIWSDAVHRIIDPPPSA